MREVSALVPGSGFMSTDAPVALWAALDLDSVGTKRILDTDDGLIAAGLDLAFVNRLSVCTHKQQGFRCAPECQA